MRLPSFISDWLWRREMRKQGALNAGDTWFITRNTYMNFRVPRNVHVRAQGYRVTSNSNDFDV